MTRKDFILIASALNSSKPDINYLAETDQWVATVKAVAKSLRQTNAAFREGTFYEACGLLHKYW